MSEQQPLWPPASHAQDAMSSHEAEAEVTASGVRGYQMRTVMKLVETHPGSTAGELARFSGHPLSRVQVARRLYDLHCMRRVRQGDLRRCMAARRRALTWWLP